MLEFLALKGVDHRDHDDWMASIHVDVGLSKETEACFRWGDEALDDWSRTSRIVRLDNAATVTEGALWQGRGKLVGTTAATGESEAHRRLKLYVARTPELLHIPADAVSELEHEFCTGDRVDLLFENHRPVRSVVKVELGGEQDLIVGLHQAITYRSLAAAKRTMPLDTPKVRAFVVSYDEPGIDFRLARGCDVGLLAVDRERVLAPTA